MLENTFSSRQRLDVGYVYNETHEPLGSDNSSALFDTPDEYTTHRLSGDYGFGVESAMLRANLGAFYEDREYDNHQFGPAGQPQTVTRERDVTGGGLVVYYQLMPKTSLLGEIRTSTYDYDWSDSDLDNDEVAYLAGVTWEATAKTTGYAKGGIKQKEFDESGKDDADDFSWEIGTTWSPTAYSSFDFSTMQYYDEGSGQEDYRDVMRLDAGWNHSWMDRLSSRVELGYEEEEFEGEGKIRDGLEEETWDFGVSVDYQFRRFLSFGASYRYTDESASGIENSSEEEFDRSIFGINMEISI